MDNIKKGLLTASLAVAVPLLATLEGYSPKPYYDIAGVLTDCYGNTKQVSHSNVRTVAQCEALLHTESGRIGKRLLDDKDIPWDVPLLASGISFVYNIGDGAYLSSTYRKYLKAGKFYDACHQMYRWVYVTQGGRKVKSRGLHNRRDKEVSVCLDSPLARV